MKLILVQSTLALVFMFIFLKGYFPFTHHKARIINPPTDIEGTPLNLDQFYKPQVQKLILIIIDALRYDFITENNMPFLHSNMDCLLKVKVEAPTVTLPRLKALTTGAVPQFIDIILNLGSTAKVADSFLHRAHASGKKMVFYGDNTWLKMFPQLFARSEGTSSFFVNDFTEVDDNVTRHLDAELKEDWHMMFLHYLGLDHIGHVKGPFSSLIPPKLHEMDNIIEKIITASNSWVDETIIMVTGDHGMKDSGGHGGTTYAETHVPLILHHNKGIHCASHSGSSKSHEIIQQSDIANTISALFGIAMPASSAGKVLPQLLTCDKAQLLYTLHYNSMILQRNAEDLSSCHDNLHVARNLFKNVVQTSNFEGPEASQAEQLFSECLAQMSHELIESSVKQDAVLLVFAMFGTINCFLIVCFRLKRSFTILHLCATIISLVACCFTDHGYNYEMQFIATILIGILTLITFTRANVTKIPKPSTRICQLVPFIVHGSLLVSSSYIEEEHYIFYYFTCTTSVLIAIANYQNTKRVTISTAMPLTVIEIIRMARAIGDSKHWLLKDEHLTYLQILHAVALIATVVVIAKLQNSDFGLISFATIAITCVCIYAEKFYFARSIVFAQTIWLLILAQFLLALCLRRQHAVLIAWMLVMAFQLRPYNTLLLPAIVMCSCILKKSLLTLTRFRKVAKLNVVIHVWLGYTFFFIQGHRNSIANVDLAPGYLGLSSYVPALVGLLTLCHSYGFQTLSMLLLFSNTIDIGSTKRNEQAIRSTQGTFMKTWSIVFGYKLFILLVIYIVIYISRGHLFVWSVFAPKLLIECMHTFVVYLHILLYCIYKSLRIGCAQ